MARAIRDVGWVMGKEKATYSHMCLLLLRVNQKIMSASAQEMVMSTLPALVAAGMVWKFVHVERDSRLDYEKCALGNPFVSQLGGHELPEDLPVPLILSFDPRHV